MVVSKKQSISCFFVGGGSVGFQARWGIGRLSNSRAGLEPLSAQPGWAYSSPWRQRPHHDKNQLSSCPPPNWLLMNHVTGILLTWPALGEPSPLLQRFLPWPLSFSPTSSPTSIRELVSQVVHTWCTSHCPRPCCLPPPGSGTASAQSWLELGGTWERR